MSQILVSAFSKHASADMTKRYSNQITITSASGVGSSTLIGRLQARYMKAPYRFVSGGGMFRERAKQFNFATIEEFAAYNRANPQQGHDAWCDRQLASFAKQNFTIIESRLAHAFAPMAFHVLLVCDLEKRAARRHADSIGTTTFDDMSAKLRKRDADDEARYSKLYPGCIWSTQDYDLVIDTGIHSKEETETAVIEGHKEWVRKHAENNLIVYDIYGPSYELPAF